ncbi:ABC-F family ATP-binding cassette domain-containing protein [Brevundimonas aurantiaca]|jgi:ATPase subunit of ABC transporter with duplicated ATPase domains|uniref:ATPase subunit of ABC transporter with duplicated ATPase domains n=2 Tax=Brevundimonas aurantiaca TaxID=74316 RepID=A0A7W9F9U0_9CAUL|nr:ABC-F family ATP-binding cassette domain-containing protein [Brevundimonas aurantiaca]MBB5739693.1 ATPase subunit of ABC transporter with duplicated ATPase domains [Brevundimonas aurantiaca]
MPTSPSRSASPSALATLDKVAARTPDGVTLFDNLSLTFGPERTGVVGRNGAGKSTLLRLIAGDLSPSEGSVTRAASVGVLDQRSDPSPDETTGQTLGVAPALAAIDRLLAGEGDAQDMADADWTLEPRIASALAEVGLEGLPMDRATRSLSGGEQTRLRLAGLILAAPDLILLDEPTNHLDVEARRWVAEVLGRWKGGAVVVSHDRDLLRRMDRIVEVSGLGVAVHGGNYDLYAARKAIERETAERDLVEAERTLARVAADAQRRTEMKARRDAAGRRKAAKGDMPRILIDARAERAENSGGADRLLAVRQAAEAETALAAAHQGVERVRTLAIPMPATGLAAGRTVATLSGAVWTTQGGRRIVGPVDLTLTGPERVAVTGPNGAGKTTLLRLITGDLAPTSGQVQRPVPAALLDQEAALLRPQETLVEAWMRLNPDGSVQEAQAALARFLFRNTAAHRRVGDLSGGERLRAALACVMTGTRPPQLLVLDEPTNHLDLDSVAAVEAALSAYDGALVVVSHDADFLAAVGIDRTVSLARPSA